jgi:hypothetical protein
MNDAITKFSGRKKEKEGNRKPVQIAEQKNFLVRLFVASTFLPQKETLQSIPRVDCVLPVPRDWGDCCICRRTLTVPCRAVLLLLLPARGRIIALISPFNRLTQSDFWFALVDQLHTSTFSVLVTLLSSHHDYKSAELLGSASAVSFAGFASSA